jgi:hypothetical protein
MAKLVTPLTSLTFLANQLVAAIDLGAHATVPEVKEHVAETDFFDWLQEHLRGQADLSLLSRPAKARIRRQLLDISRCYAGHERHLFGVERNGLLLLVSWVVEIVQRRDFTRASR